MAYHKVVEERDSEECENCKALENAYRKALEDKEQNNQDCNNCKALEAAL